jgi:hypothetical protein
MPKVFKDPSRHFKPSDHQNKPHITLVNGMPFKNLANYIYNGIKEIHDEAIVRSANQRGYSIIYFTDPKKTIENTFFKNKEDVKTGRAKLKLLIAGLIINAEKETNIETNSKIKVELASLRKLAFDFDRDIKVGDLKKPLQKILNEITTPKEEKRKKLISPYRFTKLRARGIDRQALSRFNKMDEVELSNLINLIFPSNNVNTVDKNALIAHYVISKNSIRIMQKFINIYIHLRTTTTSNLVGIAKALGDVKLMEVFCQAWAKTRKDFSNNAYVKSKCAIHHWASEMDVIVAVLNKRLFQMQSANTPYFNTFAAKINGAEKNIFSSTISPAGLIAYDAIQSPNGNLSPGYLIEDSAEKKLSDALKRYDTKNTENIPRKINFIDSPSQVLTQSQIFIDSGKIESTSPRLMSSPTTLTPSVIERLQNSRSSLSDELYFSALSPINSPTTFLQRQPSSAVANQQSINDEEFNQLLDELAFNDNFSMGVETRQNRNDVNNSNSEGFNPMFDGGNAQACLNSEETDFLTKADYGNIERTPEKRDPDVPSSMENEIQSILRKASSKLTYEPMPTQQVLNSNPNPSITNAINNSINNRN